MLYLLGLLADLARDYLCFPRGYPACGRTFLCLPFRVSVVAVDITSLTTLPFRNSARIIIRWIIIQNSHNS